MPGPGGGSRGGGGGFGGGRGGSFGGGGFGGGRGGSFGGGPRPGGFGHHHPHHHHHHHYGWGWGFGRRRYYGGSGCFGALMAPVFLGIFFIFLLAYLLFPSGDSNDMLVGNYDEAKMQAAADRVYSQTFKQDATYEDNILLYVLVDEDCKQLCYIAWVGDNIKTDISNLFGNDYTELGHSIYANVPEYYAYSIDSNLAAVVEDMGKIIADMDLSSSFKKDPVTEAQASESKLIDLRVGEDAGKLPSLTAATVNSALEEFRFVIAVDYIDNVFGAEGMDGDTVLMIFILAVILIVVIVVSVSSAKNRKKRNASEEKTENRYKDD